MQNNNEPTNKLEELESACEETKISSIAKKKQKLAQDEDLLENEIIEELVEEDTTEEATYKEIGPKRLVLRRFFISWTCHLSKMGRKYCRPFKYCKSA